MKVWGKIIHYFCIFICYSTIETTFPLVIFVKSSNIQKLQRIPAAAYTDSYLSKFCL